MEIVSLGLGLMILIAVNIVLGSLSAIFQNEFCHIKLRRGITKAGIVAVCFAATYLVGYLNPNIVAVEVNGVQVSVKTGIDLVVLVGYYHYAKQVIEKLTEIIKGDLFVSEISIFKGFGKKNDKNEDGHHDEQSEAGSSEVSLSDVAGALDTPGRSQEEKQELSEDIGLDDKDYNMKIVVHLFIYEVEENDSKYPAAEPKKEIEDLEFY